MDKQRARSQAQRSATKRSEPQRCLDPGNEISSFAMAPRRNRIRIYHPDYDPPELLLMLPADDGPDHDNAPYLVIHDAVHAFANHPSDGWLSKSQGGRDRIEKSVVWIKAGNYFYHVAGSNKPWPVVANFDSWSFPHAQGVPSHWREASDAPANHFGHGSPAHMTATCRITARELALENAHIIPRAEKSWFGTNRMDQYGNIGGRTGDSVAESSANRIWLTSDAHKIWDQSQFTIIPDVQEQEHGVEVVGWRTHRLNEHREVLEEWHNKPLRSVGDCAGEYFYARFVWDIFPLIQGFLHSGPPRRLVVYNQSQSKYEIKMLTKAERRVFTLNQGRTRSASPTKRQRSTQPDDHLECASKRPKLSSPDGSRDSAVAGMRDWSGDFSDESDETPVLRHPRPSRSPDFLPAWALHRNVRRGRAEQRS